MNFSENLRLAWSCVKANKMRSLLTMLGIIIGISAVITISTIGSSLKQTISNTFSDMMNTNQLAATWLYMGEGSSDPADVPVKFDIENSLEFKDAFAEQISEVMLTSGFEHQGVYEDKDNTAMVNVIGSSEGYCKTNKYEMVLGRDIEFKDSKENRKVCVVSELFVKYALDNMDNPIGKRIEIALGDDDVFSAYIIGVYKMSDKQSNIGQSKVSDKDKITDMVIPISYAWDLNGKADSERYCSEIYFMAAPGVNTDTLKENVTNYFKNKAENGSKDYYFLIQSLEQQLGMISNVLNIVTIAISVIAAISLIVGGIGVMNIMLVSVVERTKEIGIRKALGAKNKVIEAQFLVESVLICAIGGIIGIIVGMINGGLIALVVKYIVSNSEEYSFLTVSVSPPLGAIIVSFLFSSLVGIVFGLYPARRAARLSPIDALRYE